MLTNLYDLKKFDLNLLVIFECIYQHLSISKAAETLYITPSAVSQSLQRLRAQISMTPCSSAQVRELRRPRWAPTCIIILNRISTKLSRRST